MYGKGVRSKVTPTPKLDYMATAVMSYVSHPQLCLTIILPVATQCVNNTSIKIMEMTL